MYIKIRAPQFSKSIGCPGFDPRVWEGPLGKGPAAHSSIQDRRIPGTVQSQERVGHDWATFTLTHALAVPGLRALISQFK